MVDTTPQKIVIDVFLAFSVSFLATPKASEIAQRSASSISLPPRPPEKKFVFPLTKSFVSPTDAATKIVKDVVITFDDRLPMLQRNLSNEYSADNIAYQNGVRITGLHLNM